MMTPPKDSLSLESALALIEMQKKALDLTLKEAPLSEILDILVSIVEKETEGDAIASILIMDESGKHLLHGAAPHLPAVYNDAIHGIAIGPDVGSCGRAAFTGKTVIVEDIQVDPLWKNFKDLAGSFGLRACWSTPFISSRGKILGTFALYHKTPYHPLKKDQELVTIATHTAAIVIERQEEIKQRLAAESRLNLALVSGNIGFWDWSAQTGHTFLSHTLMNDWGIDPNTFKHTLSECMERIHPDDREKVMENIQKSLEEAVPYDIDYRVIRPSGELIWVNAKGRYLADENGQPDRLSGITINVTERRHVEDKLREALRARDEFLSIASHELKTPLTALKLQNQTQLRLISKNHPAAFNPGSIKENIEMSERQLTRLVRLIDDMLDVSRIRSGKLSISTAPFDLCEVVTDVLKRLSVQITESSYPLPTLKLCEGAIGNWDRLRIEQVIINLITNAIKYGKQRPFEIGITKCTQHVLITVKDQGIGIPAEVKEKIFDRFERAISSNEVSGLGLGLYITSEIVKAHKGKIWVESQSDEGSTFFVELPLK